MPAAYSADIRGRVIASVESGSSRREAAEEFDRQRQMMSLAMTPALVWRCPKAISYHLFHVVGCPPRGKKVRPCAKTGAYVTRN
jgi:hypothetical protein